MPTNPTPATGIAAAPPADADLPTRVAAVLTAAGYAESPMRAGRPQDATFWPYGFVLDTTDERPAEVQITLWDQVWERDRTSDQRQDYAIRMVDYANTLMAAGLGVTVGYEADRLPWLVVTGPTGGG